MDVSSQDLFFAPAQKLQLADNLFLLKAFALENEAKLLNDLQDILNAAPPARMMTKMGFQMSAAMTNCGDFGWVSDRSGYRYDAINPATKTPWPALPQSFLTLAENAAQLSGFENFTPDACLINQYEVGASMGLHQDKNELDLTQPIVSVSLGIAATFLFGGLKRSDKPMKIPLMHGDVVVWGGEDRLKFHGILPLKAAHHPTLGACRINLTFRQAG